MSRSFYSIFIKLHTNVQMISRFRYQMGEERSMKTPEINSVRRRDTRHQ